MIQKMPLRLFVHQKRIKEIREYFEEKGYSVLNINDREINSIQSFFKYISNYLPLDPPISGQIHFDALEDSLFDGLVSLNSSNIVIIWENADTMFNNDINSMIKVIVMFNDVMRSLYKYEKVHLVVIYIGGNDFFPEDFEKYMVSE